VTGTDAANAIDTLMERACEALSRTQYFDAAALSTEALALARRADDFDRMARICLPLQEARRWIRQEACDAGRVMVVSGPEDLGEHPEPGCYLVQPPLIGVDARQIRQQCWALHVPVFVLCREPMSRDGLWPVVGVAERVARVKVRPPEAVTADPQARPTGDRITGPISVPWLEQAAEALGDRAIAEAHAASDPADPPAWIVDDFLDLLEACPEHEKFLQALAGACRDAIGSTTPTDRRRRRGVGADPHAF
jgi:hypothetical protein